MTSRLDPNLEAIARLMALEATVKQMLRYGQFPPDIEAAVRVSFTDAAYAMLSGQRARQFDAFQRYGYQQIDQLFFD